MENHDHIIKGLHIVIYDKIAYPLPNQYYMELATIRRDLALAKKDENEDNLSSCYNNYYNFLQWMEINIKPVSIEDDNLDIDIYFKQTETCAFCNATTLPF